MWSTVDATDVMDILETGKEVIYCNLKNVVIKKLTEKKVSDILTYITEEDAVFYQYTETTP